MKGICALTGQISELQSSHIYPKFSVKYLRETSANGLLRSFQNINIARQDGLKIPLLSLEAEQKFSKSETWFANNFFHPAIKSDKKAFSYDNHLYYFAVSLLWRGLIVNLKNEKIKNDNCYLLLQQCEKEWRRFLKDGEIPYMFGNIFMMAVSLDTLIVPNLEKFQYYLLRDLDTTIVTDGWNNVYVYAKLPRFIFWAPLNSPMCSIPNLIDNLGGYFDSTLPPEEPIIMDFLINRVKEINKLQSLLTPKQMEATLERATRDSERFLSSEAGQLMVNNK